jgi:DNA-binding LacI/PurR family transcriptional regulator
MSAKAPPRVRPDRRTAIRQAAATLIARAEQRAATCGGSPHEYVTEATYQALRAALRGEGDA